MMFPLLILTLAQSPVEPTPDEWLAQRGYRYLYGTQGTMRRAIYDGPGWRLTILVDGSAPPPAPTFPRPFRFGDGAAEERWGNAGHAGYDLPDGLPLGTGAMVRTGPGGFKVRFRAPHCEGAVFISDKYVGGERHAVTLQGLQLVEAAARQEAALCEGRRLGGRGRAVPGLTVLLDGGGLDRVDLAAWAALRGWAAALDDDVGTTTLTRGAHTVLVPLSANKVRVDGAWKDLPDVTMLKDGRWWVPLDALEAATKGL